ncbi:MAG: family 3 adenylate cyclase [Chitinophagaceae bacterium]|nr:family 3 adenylate cyclase [Chitinophagaceae bacterium]
MKPDLTISQSDEAALKGADIIPLVDELNEQSFELRHLDQKKSAKLGEKARNLSEKENYKKGLGDALLNIGFQQLSASSYREAFNSFNDALRIFRELNNAGGIAHSYYNLGLVYLRIGDFDTAMEVQQQSIKIRQQLNDEPGFASCKAQIGYLNSQFGLDEAALKDYTDCLAIWRKRDNKAGIANVLMALGTLKLKLNQLSEAKEHLLESMNIRIALNEINGVHGSINYLSAVLLKEGNAEGACQLLKDALNTAVNQEQPYTIGICRLRLSLAKVYTVLNDHPAALEQLENALSSALSSGQQYQLHDIYQELSNLYKSIGFFDKALEYYEKFHVSKEAIINLNAATKLKNLEMINKVETREKEIEIHRLKNIELKERNRLIREERKKSDALLLNILPLQTAKELKKNGSARPRQYNLVTVLFCDFVSFTQTAEKLSPEQLVNRLDSYFRAFDMIATKNNIEKIKTIGDAYMAAGGIPLPNGSNPEDVVRGGLQILEHVKAENDPLFNIRIGIHSGPVVAGIVGIKKFVYDIWGDTVNIASRMESSGQAGKVNISSSTYELIKDKFECTYRGKVDAKKKGMIDMYFVESAIGHHIADV